LSSFLGGSIFDVVENGLAILNCCLILALKKGIKNNVPGNMMMAAISKRIFIVHVFIKKLPLPFGE
jgi:hypothetical protein